MLESFGMQYHVGLLHRVRYDLFLIDVGHQLCINYVRSTGKQAQKIALCFFGTGTPERK